MDEKKAFYHRMYPLAAVAAATIIVRKADVSRHFYMQTHKNNDLCNFIVFHMAWVVIMVVGWWWCRSRSNFISLCIWLNALERANFGHCYAVRKVFVGFVLNAWKLPQIMQ